MALNSNKIWDIDERTFRFVVRIIKMVLSLPNNVAAWKIGGQIIASATSINSNVVQAKGGISKKDFTNHLRISLKEARETKRWQEMIIAAGLMKKERMILLLQENEEIICILVKSVLKAEKNI